MKGASPESYRDTPPHAVPRMGSLLYRLLRQAPEARQLLAQRVSAGYRVYKVGKHRRCDTCLTPTLKT